MGGVRAHPGAAAPAARLGAGQGRQGGWQQGGLAVGAAVWGSRCAGGLAPCPPAAPVVAVGAGLAGGLPPWDEGRLWCRTHPAPTPTQVLLPRHVPSFPTPGFTAWPLHVPAPAFNFFDATPPRRPQPLQCRCGCAIPQLSCLHQRLTKHSCPRQRLQPLQAAEPHTWLPCHNLVWFYPLARARITPLSKLRALVVAIAYYTRCGWGNRPTPTSQPPSSLCLLPGQDLDEEQNQPWRLAASGHQLNPSASSRARFPQGLAQQQVTLAHIIRQKGQHRRKSLTDTRSGFKYTCIPWGQSVQPPSPVPGFFRPQ